MLYRSTGGDKLRRLDRRWGRSQRFKEKIIPPAHHETPSRHTPPGVGFVSHVEQDRGRRSAGRHRLDILCRSASDLRQPVYK